jgi:hypothetical protein
MIATSIPRPVTSEHVKTGKWRLGLYWSWNDAWTVAVVRMTSFPIGALVLGPLCIVAMWPAYREDYRDAPTLAVRIAAWPARESVA